MRSQHFCCASRSLQPALPGAAERQLLAHPVRQSILTCFCGAIVPPLSCRAQQPHGGVIRRESGSSWNGRDREHIHMPGFLPFSRSLTSCLVLGLQHPSEMCSIGAPLQALPVSMIIAMLLLKSQLFAFMPCSIHRVLHCSVLDGVDA